MNNYEDVIKFSGGTVYYILEKDNRGEYTTKLPHRTDGPAIITNSGHPEFALNGCEMSFDGWCKALGLNENEKMLMRLKWNVTT